MTVRLERLSLQADDGRLVIDIPALDIEAGSLTSIVGHGDAGQSTVLRLMGGLETASTGRVTVDGQVVGASGPTDRGMAYLVLPGMIHLLQRLGQTPSMLPPLVLVDGVRQGDEQGRWDDTRRALDRVRELGAAVVYATDDPDRGLDLSDQVAALREGRLVQAGPPATLVERPNSTVVATLFGDPPMNIARAILEKDGCAVQVGPRSLQIAGEIAETFCRDVYVGVRPERLRLHCSPPTGWPGQVTGSRVHGGQSFVEVAVDGARFVVLDRQDARPSAGSRVGLTLHPSDLHVFDDRGDRLDIQ